MKNGMTAAIAAVVAASGVASADMLADSALDFSGAQGANSWFYGYYDNGAFTPISYADMTVFSGNSWRESMNQTWTFVKGDTMHGNAAGTSRSSTEQAAVRRWVSDFDGQIELTGEIAHAYSEARGDGTTAKIFVDGQLVYSFDVAAGDSLGTSYSVLATVSQGSTVDFVLESGATANYDTTRFTSQITSAVPAPASAALLGLGGLVATRRRR